MRTFLAGRAFALVGLLIALAQLIGCSADRPPVPGDAAWEVELTGSGMRWQITDPGFDRKLGTSDDLRIAPPLRLPAGTRARIILQSDDYLYTFAIPDRRVQEIAVPGQTYTLEFNSGLPRTSNFRGDQFCGYAHEALSGVLLVEEWSAYRHWQANQQSSIASPVPET